MGPNSTGNILVLYGHGAVTEEKIDFKRPNAARINLYSWTREGIPVWDVQIKLAAEDALSAGKIRDSYATVNSSRIGGTLMKDMLIGAPIGLQLPDVPNGYNVTPLPDIGATAHHNKASLANSDRILVMINNAAGIKKLSEIMASQYFNNRAFDLLWCACKSDLN